jgi:hypothetical protein
MWKDAAGEKHSFSVSARKADFAERGRSLLSGIKLDDKPSIVPEKVCPFLLSIRVEKTVRPSHDGGPLWKSLSLHYLANRSLACPFVLLPTS